MTDHDNELARLRRVNDASRADGRRTVDAWLAWTAALATVMDDMPPSPTVWEITEYGENLTYPLQAPADLYEDIERDLRDALNGADALTAAVARAENRAAQNSQQVIETAERGRLK